MLPQIDPTATAAWKKLSAHFEAIRPVHLRSLFAADPGRFERFSIRLGDILVDYSKNRITTETMGHLIELAETCGLKAAIESMFTGEPINATERRAVLHTALRNRANTPVVVDGDDVMPAVNAVLAQMKDFSEKVGERAVDGLHRQADHRHRQHRHRRLGPRAGDGHRVPEALCPAGACDRISSPTSTAPTSRRP